MPTSHEQRPVAARCRGGVVHAAQIAAAVTAAAVLAHGGSAIAQAAPSKAAPSKAAPPRLEPDGTVAPGQSPLAHLRTPGQSARISNETTISRWTYARTRAIVRAQPSGGARQVTRLRFAGGAATRELYGVLDAKVDRIGRVWLRVRLPGRPNGRTGWATASSFDGVRTVRTQLVIDRSDLRATLFKEGRQIWTARVAIGKASTPTPLGSYYIARKEGAIFGPVYGPRVFFTTAWSSVPDWPGGGLVGIHGTNQPGLIPGRPSHGCIRIRNADISRLYRLTPVGTPLKIR